MADDDVAAERARLEALAWGGSAPADEAAAARLALQALARGGRRASRPVDSPQPGGTPAPVPPLAAPTRSAPTAVSASGSAPGAASGPPVGGGDHVDDAPRSDGDEPRLPAGTATTWRTRAVRSLWTTRPRVWIAIGTAALVGVAFAAGTVVGTARQDQSAAPSVTPTPGSVTLEDLLDRPQTYADQLPGSVEAPVSLRTTRLIFSNRALDGGSFRTPWSVWAGVGTDRSTICLVATANRIESTSACYPRADALHGSVSLSAQSTSGTLTLALRGGGVQGMVTNEG